MLFIGCLHAKREVRSTEKIAVYVFITAELYRESMNIH